MDIIDILGGLLKHKSGGAGKGGDILSDILKGGPRSQPQPRSAPGPTSREMGPQDIASTAQELEDLLNVAHGRNSQRTSGQSTPARKPAPQAEADWPDAPISARRDPPASVQPSAVNQQNERALVLVRAMVNAAKCDGQISPAEQRSILEHVDSSSPETIQFLRDEFARPLDIREFALSVPLGMEREVYTLSLIAIDLDSAREEGYLNELAQLLRIPPNVRAQIHQQLGAPRVG